MIPGDQQKSNHEFSEQIRDQKGLIDARLFLPSIDWDVETAKKLSAAEKAIDLLVDMLATANIQTTPPDLAPLMMSKAVDVRDFYGLGVALRAPYLTIQDVLPDAGPSTRDQLIQNYYNYLVGLPERAQVSEGGTVDLHQLYVELTGTEYQTQPGYRTSAGLNIEGILPPAPPAADIPDLLGSLNSYINVHELTHPLVRIGLVFAEISGMQPFETENAGYSMVLLDYLVVRWTRLELPAYNFARWLFANRFEYFRCLRAYHLEGAVTQWLGFFLDGFQACLNAGVKKLLWYRELYMDMTNQLLDLDSDLDLERMAPYLMRQPIFSRHSLSQYWQQQESVESLLEVLLRRKIIRQIPESRNEPIFICEEVLEFWEDASEMKEEGD